MFKLKRNALAVEFCERCGSACYQACRANKALERARFEVLGHGSGLA